MINVSLQAENNQLTAQLSLVQNTCPSSARLSSQLEKFRHGKAIEHGTLRTYLTVSRRTSTNLPRVTMLTPIGSLCVVLH